MNFQKLLLNLVKPLILAYFIKAAAKDVANDAECQAYLASLPPDSRAACEGFVPLMVAAVAEKVNLL